MFLFRDVTLSENKEIRASLKQIYGIGWYKANKIADIIGFSKIAGLVGAHPVCDVKKPDVDF